MRSALPWLAAAVAALALFLGWIVLAREDQAAARTVVDVDGGASAVLVAPGSSDEPSAVPSADGPERRALAATLATEHDPADGAARTARSTKPPIGAITVRVVYASDDTPAAGAEVDVFTTSHHDEDRRLLEYERAKPPDTAVRFSAWYDPFAGGAYETLRADADGCVHLRRGFDQLHLRARAVRDGVMHRGQREQQPFGSRDSTHQLWLTVSVERSVDVRVVDGSGAPVPALPIAAVHARKATEVVAHATTDDDGRARLEDRSGEWARAEQDGVALRVRAVAVLSPPLEAPLSDGPIELVLPPTGSVVLTSAGNTVPKSAMLTVAGAQDDVQTHVLMRDGRARFPHVGLGLALEGSVFGFETAGPEAFAGPQLLHEEVEHEMTSVVRRRLLEVRLVLADGRPFAERGFGFTAHLAGMALNMPGRTDAEGRALLDGAPLDEPAPRLVFQALGEAQGGLRPRLEAKVDAAALAHEPRQERVDLGTVVLEAKPLLASGVVRDADGVPVDGAAVQLRYDGPAPRGAPSTHSHAEGAFALWGEASENALGLYAQSRAVGTSSTIAFAPGARGLELVLDTHGALQVDVRLPDALPTDAISIRYEQDDGATFWLSKRPRPKTDTATDLRYAHTELPPGRGVLIARTGKDEELARTAVAVRSGETTDAGLFDLGAELATVELVVRDADGADLDDVTVRDAGAEPPRSLVEHAKSPMRLPAPRGPARWTVASPNKRTTTVEVAGERVEVVLAEALAVQLTLPAGYPPPGAARGRLWLHASNANGATWIQPLELSSDNRWTARFGEPGRWTARFRPEKGFLVLGAGGAEFEITEAHLESGGPIELPIDLETWTAFLEQATPR